MIRAALVNAEWLTVPPVDGGAVERTLYETARGVRTADLTVISPWSEKLLHWTPEPEGLFRHVDVANRRERIQDLLGRDVPQALRNPRHYFYYLDGLTDIIREIDPDVIQIHNRTDFIPYLVRQFPGKKFVAYMHNQPGITGQRVDGVLSEIDRWIFVSDHLRRRYLREYPSIRDRCEVIYNGLDPSCWHPGRRDSERAKAFRQDLRLVPGQSILFVGRTVREKGIRELLVAMKRVRKEMPEAKLIVAGSPLYGKQDSSPFHRHLEQMAERLGNAVEFVGYVDHSELPDLYASCDMTVVPSLWDEPFGKVVIESMACGVPVVGTGTGAIPEILTHGVDGYLIDQPGDDRKLAKLICDALQNPDALSRAGKAARSRVVQDFTLQGRLEQMNMFYQTLCEGDAIPGYNSTGSGTHETAEA